MTAPHTTRRTARPFPAVVPEPALRPLARPGPGIERSHWARLFVQDGALVVRRRDGFGRRVERRVPLTGPGAPHRAFFVPDAVRASRVGKPRPADADPPREIVPGGEIRLLDADGALVATVLPHNWTPEGMHRGPEESLELSGAKALLTAAGIPLTLLDGPDAPEAQPGPRRQERRAVLSPGGLLPPWYAVLRLSAGAAWFALFSVLHFAGGGTSLVLTAAVLAFIGPVARLGLRAVTACRNRSAARLTPPPRIRVTPRPAPPGSRAPVEPGHSLCTPTVRFVRRASLAVLPHELSLVDQYGADHRWPLTGPAAPITLRRLVGPDGRPVSVELRGPGDRRTGLVDWEDWFGGPGGEDAWRSFAGQTRLRQENYRVSANGAALRGFKGGNPTAYPAVSNGEARREAAFPGYSQAGAGVLVASLLSVTLAGTIRAESSVAAGFCTLLGLSGLLLQVVPWLGFHLHSRLRLERPYTAPAPREGRAR